MHAGFRRFLPKDTFTRRLVYGITTIGGIHMASEYNPTVRHITQSTVRNGRIGLACFVVALDFKLTRYYHEKWADILNRDDYYYGWNERLQLRSARRILRAIETNGGVYVKLGQHLSALTYLLPSEWTLTFRVLQKECPPSSLPSILKLVREETGYSVDELFSEFNPEPIGVASLAQVHQAILTGSGDTVAVKIQHPGLDEFAKMDVKAVTWIVGMLARFFPDFELSWLAEEMNEQLPKELDFRFEEKHAAIVTKNFEGSKFDVRIPKVYWSNKRLICMEYIDGGHLDDVDYMRKHGIDPKEVVQELNEIILNMIFNHGWLHCDPHFGNVMIEPKRHPRQRKRWMLSSIFLPHHLHPRNFNVVLLDHGLYKTLSSEFRYNYAKTWYAIIAGDEEEMKRSVNALLPGDTEAAQRLYKLLVAILTGREWDAIAGQRTSQPQSMDEASRMREAFPKLLKEITEVLRKVPRELLLVFKTNDLVRAAEVHLTGKSLGSMLRMAEFCLRVIREERVSQGKRRGKWWKVGLAWMDWCWMTVRLHIASMLLNVNRMARQSIIL